MDTYLAIVQTAAVVAAVGGLIVALKIAADDRRIAETSAKEDRKLARAEAERRHRLDLLIRLSQNYERGGSSDPIERSQLGAEATALVTALGPEVLPKMFELHGSYDDARQELASKPASEWGWRERADAVRLALRDVAASYPE